MKILETTKNTGLNGDRGTHPILAQGVAWHIKGLP